MRGAGLKQGLVAAPIFLTLFALGYFGRGLLSIEVSRDQRFIELWDTYCAPIIDGQLIRGIDELVRLEQFPDTNRWADPSSKLILNIQDHTCQISDVLLPLSPQERDDVEASFSKYVSEKYPDYHIGQSPWQVAREWRDVKSPVHGQPFWLITLNRMGEEWGGAYTFAALHAEQKHPFTESLGN